MPLGWWARLELLEAPVARRHLPGADSMLSQRHNGLIWSILIHSVFIVFHWGIFNAFFCETVGENGTDSVTKKRGRFASEGGTWDDSSFRKECLNSLAAMGMSKFLSTSLLRTISPFLDLSTLTHARPLPAKELSWQPWMEIARRPLQAGE